MEITRRESKLFVRFDQSGMEIYGMYRGKAELELKVALFPYAFHESLKLAVDNGQTAYPYIPLSFGRNQHFTLYRQDGLKNGEVWFTLKTITPGFFTIELREQEIKYLLADMRRYMTASYR